MLRLFVVASLLIGCRVSLDSEPEQGLCVVDNTLQCLDAVGKSDLRWIETNVFDASCTFSGCHGDVGNDSNINLEIGKSHASLVNFSSATEANRKLVVPNDVEASMLMLVLGHVAPANANPPAAALPAVGFMPRSAPLLCCQKLDAIERWINAGAQNN
jgi:hypothetical protein